MQVSWLFDSSLFKFLFKFSVFSTVDTSHFGLQGYTIPLDKRLAADGRGLQDPHINDKFAKLAEALYIADRKVQLPYVLILFVFDWALFKWSDNIFASNWNAMYLFEYTWLKKIQQISYSEIEQTSKISQSTCMRKRSGALA